MEYNSFKYIFPPRTEMKCKFGSTSYDMWKKFPDSIAQWKLNGTRNLIIIFPDGHIECWNRHSEVQKQYILTPSIIQGVKDMDLPFGKFHILDSELLHSKTKDIKDVIYLFDILVYNSEYLLGKTYGDRYSLLSRVSKKEYFPETFDPKSGKIYLANNFSFDKWDWMWENAQKINYCEGMVLKRCGIISRLGTGYRNVNNDSFMMRVRKSSKNYLI